MLNIIRAGLYTSVQDGGRHGFRQSGVSHCGALDKPAMQIANLLVGPVRQCWKLPSVSWLWSLRPTAGLP